MSTGQNPFVPHPSRPSLEGPFAPEELGLAARNHGMPLEALRHDVTPAGLHYTLSHFDIPAAEAGAWTVSVSGAVERPISFSLADLAALPQRTLRVTMECAGNGRAGMTPRYPSMPWGHEGVSTSDWTGAPLRHLLELAGLRHDVVDVAFIGADRGFDRGVEHDYGRSLSRAMALGDDVLVATAMNGAPLPPQHGYPVRLIVPRWYGMASVKWLVRIEALTGAFDGFQQVVGYHIRKTSGERGTPITTMRVKALMVPPGIPDWYTRRRMVEAGRVALTGRAWSGESDVVRVEVAVDGRWRDARVEPRTSALAWQRWTFDWDAVPGDHVLAVRATDASGDRQPDAPDWNIAGMCNNSIQQVPVTVRSARA